MQHFQGSTFWIACVRLMAAVPMPSLGHLLCNFPVLIFFFFFNYYLYLNSGIITMLLAVVGGSGCLRLLAQEILGLPCPWWLKAMVDWPGDPLSFMPGILPTFTPVEGTPFYCMMARLIMWCQIGKRSDVSIAAFCFLKLWCKGH